MLNNRHKMALIFWRNADDTLPLGLIGCSIYHSMVCTIPSYNTEGRLALENQKKDLEKTVTQMVDLCFSKSEVSKS